MFCVWQSAPGTTASRIFLIFYSALGIVAAGYLLDTMGRLVLVLLTVAYRRLAKVDMSLVSELKAELAACGVLLLSLATALTVVEDGSRGGTSWTFWESVYFSFISLTTIGLGDYAPLTHAGRAITVIGGILGLGLLASTLSSVASVLSKYEQAAATRAAAGVATLARPKAKARETASRTNKASADGRWALAAQAASVAVASRRGDSVKSLLPRLAMAGMVFLFWLGAGAVAFTAFERPAEIERNREYDTFQSVVDRLSNYTQLLDEQAQLLQRLVDNANPDVSVRQAAMRQRIENADDDSELQQYAGSGVQQWDWPGASFYALTVLTTG